jgi:histidyl-tRNA synthetase
MADRGVPTAAASAAMALFLEETLVPGPGGEKADNEGILTALAAAVRDRPAGTAAVDTLASVCRVSGSTAAAGRIRIDPSLARGLSYYTGAIMEINVPDLAGSLGGGGRYDNLVGMFLGQQVPACGFSLGLERIIVVMTERGMFPAHIEAVHADVLVAQWNADAAGETLALARELRAAGLRVDVYPEADKLGKQFKYASDRGVSFVAVIGDDERAAGQVTVKDLRSGAQERVARADAGGFVKARLANA